MPHVPHMVISGALLVSFLEAFRILPKVKMELSRERIRNEINFDLFSRAALEPTFRGSMTVFSRLCGPLARTSLRAPSRRARTLAHGSWVLAAEAPTGSGPVPVLPVAMYFHKKGIEITYIITTI